VVTSGSYLIPDEKEDVPIMSSFALSRTCLILAAGLTVAGCERPGSPPVAADVAALHPRSAASAHVQKLTGLSHLPVPQSEDALLRSLTRHYPRQFVGLRPRTAVLVDVTVDEKGFVRNVAVVDRPPDAAGQQVRMVVLDRAPGSNTEVAHEVATPYDQAFGPAAQAAIGEVRFHPAMREGRAVPYTLRMTVEFTSPPAS
jgi:hypothetical protein